MSSSAPHESLTIAEAVCQARKAEEDINAILKQLCEATGLRIEINYAESDFGPPIIMLRAVAR